MLQIGFFIVAWAVVWGRLPQRMSLHRKFRYNQTMKILGIICEYNPFHNGHEEQIRILREQFGSDAMIVACMSGNFVQRGEAALMDKWQRAKAAMACGVNLVLELSTIFSCSSADYFAAGAVRTLVATGLPLTLCFGSELGKLPSLQALARLRNTPPESFTEYLKIALSKGLSYAAAHEEAARNFLESEAATQFFTKEQFTALFRQKDQTALWRGSNNQLAIAYLAAIEEIEASDRPRVFTHQRSGAQYLEKNLQADFSSATAIRYVVEQLWPSSSAILKALRDDLPPQSLGVVLEALQEEALVTRAMLTPLIFSRIRATSIPDLAEYQGWDEGLPERIKHIVSSRPANANQLLGELIEKASSKRFPNARIQRALICLLLGIKKQEIYTLLEAGAPFYIRALAADKSGRYLLRRMRKSSKIPVFTKTSDYLEIPATKPEARRLAEIDRCAADVYSVLQGSYPASDFDKPMLLG